MAMLTNKTKEKLLRGDVVVGCILEYPDPGAVELLGLMGFDFVRFEGEHGPLTYMDLEHLVRAAQCVDVTPTARVPANVQHEILHYLDRGVLGVTIPHTATKADAECAVRAAKHYPVGMRGHNASGKLSLYGTAGLPVDAYYDYVNRETLVIALIEDKEGLENIEEIVAVPGVDAIDVGPSDLAQSLGLPSREAVEKAVDRIVEAAVRAGKPVGVGTAVNLRKPESMRYYRDKGCTYFLTSAGALFRYGATEALKKIREAVSA